MINNKEESIEKEENDENVWESQELDEIEYIKFASSGESSVDVKFVTPDPTVSKNQFGTKAYDFEVMDLKTEDIKILSVTSIRLMRKLREFVPLEGKDFCITRRGKAMDIDYDLTLIA